jgi:predicted HTH domain antitoxin
MSTLTLQLENELAALLHQTNQPIERAARELIVLELFRRGAISSGKAAELLGMARWTFVTYAGQLGIPFFEMTQDEWADEQARSQTL